LARHRYGNGHLFQLDSGLATALNLAMPPRIDIDLTRVRRNAEQIRSRVGVAIYAVIKADGYGLGAASVARAICDIVDGFCVFSLAEARQAKVWEVTQKPSLALGPPDGGVEDYLAAHVRPAVTTVGQAGRLREAGPVVCVETGMQRFTCPAEDVAAVIKAGDCGEAFTHATQPDQVKRLQELAPGLHLHAAGSSLMYGSACQLDAVRPGIALYRGAVRITTPLVEVHRGGGPAGYTRFVGPEHGIILAGYGHGLRAGPCLMNGVRRRILEVGMQSAYVEIGLTDGAGDEVILLGEGLEAEELAGAWGASGQEVLVSLLRAS
jgi:alanine racemase